MLATASVPPAKVKVPWLSRPGAAHRKRRRLCPEEHCGRVGQPTREGDGGIETQCAGIVRQPVEGGGLREWALPKIPSSRSIVSTRRVERAG